MIGISITSIKHKQLRISRLSAVSNIMETVEVDICISVSGKAKIKRKKSVECWYSRHKTDRSVCTANEPPFTGYYIKKIFSYLWCRTFRGDCICIYRHTGSSGATSEPRSWNFRNMESVQDSRGSQRDVVYLGLPIALSSKCGGKEGNCGVSANVYSCAHGGQINYGDLTPCLTYG